MKLYKFRSDENMEFIYDILQNKKVYCSKYKYLNDPFEGQFEKLRSTQFGSTQMGNYQMGNSRERSDIDDNYQLDNLRICSFTKSYSDVRLWSYYANSHKGLCIEFEINDELIDKQFYIVKYEDSLKTVTSSILTKEIAINILRRKTKHWEFEDEIRLINENEKYELTPQRIFLGTRANEYSIGIIEKISGGIPIVKTKLGDDLKINIIR